MLIFTNKDKKKKKKKKKKKIEIYINFTSKNHTLYTLKKRIL